MSKHKELPDGSIIHLSQQTAAQVPEALFQPTFLDIDSDGIHQIIHKSIIRSDCNLRNDLYGNIDECL